VPEADPFSFRVLHAKASPNHYGAYYQDRHAAYLEGRRMMYVDPVSNERALVDPQTFRFIAVGAPYETVVDRRYGYRISTAGGAGIEVTCKVDARTPAALPPCK